VDDPYRFGQIAVANALSDVYAMGGRPLCALNLVAFPLKTLDIGVLREILRGGLDKMREADVVLVGGHSIDDPELKYGCSVTGTVHPQRVLTNVGARPGDRLLLTKPLGTGIVNTAVKRQQAPDDVARLVEDTMASLNRAAAEALRESGAEVHACTDVTGFGLLGHLAEMLEGSQTGAVLESARVPLFPEVLRFAREGLKPGGLKRNREYRAPMVDLQDGIPEELSDALYDPQTSGGLLAAVSGDDAPRVLQVLHRRGLTDAALVGQVVAQNPPRIQVV
jgi:selenide,water dikinase